MDKEHGDIAEAVNWFLSENTEAADVMASVRESHSVRVRVANKF